MLGPKKPRRLGPQDGAWSAARCRVEETKVTGSLGAVLGSGASPREAIASDILTIGCARLGNRESTRKRYNEQTLMPHLTKCGRKKAT